MGHISGTVRATGKSFEGPFALHLTVENGRITRHRLYENSLSVAQACTP
jgi:ketosteroid isomerase-like protein